MSLLDLPLEMLTAVSQQLDLHDLVRVAATCKRFRHGEPETLELPTESPVITALRELAFARPELVPITRPIGCSYSWVAYLARSARQRRCLEAPPLAVNDEHSLFVDATRRLLACGSEVATGHGNVDEDTVFPLFTPVAGLAGVRVRSVAAGYDHSLALSWDGRIYSWGKNESGQLGHGDELARPAPALVEGFEGVRGVSASNHHSLAVTQSGQVFTWGEALMRRAEPSLRPISVEGFGDGVRVRHVHAGDARVFAIGEAGELFSWGSGREGILGHGDTREQRSPKRVEALRGVPVSSTSILYSHALALAEDGQVYAWGENCDRTVLGNPQVERELLPKPVEALRGVRVGFIAAACSTSYAVADTGELWTWGKGYAQLPPLGHGAEVDCPLPKPIESLRGVRMDAVAASSYHVLARAGDGSVYSFGNCHSTATGSAWARR
jgi:alpha-tubulin suppressor-like RCC1 family protein